MPRKDICNLIISERPRAANCASRPLALDPTVAREERLLPLPTHRIFAEHLS